MLSFFMLHPTVWYLTHERFCLANFGWKSAVVKFWVPFPWHTWAGTYGAVLFCLCASVALAALAFLLHPTALDSWTFLPDQFWLKVSGWLPELAFWVPFWWLTWAGTYCMYCFACMLQLLLLCLLCLFLLSPTSYCTYSNPRTLLSNQFSMQYSMLQFLVLCYVHLFSAYCTWLVNVSIEGLRCYIQ